MIVSVSVGFVLAAASLASATVGWLLRHYALAKAPEHRCPECSEPALCAMTTDGEAVTYDCPNDHHWRLSRIRTRQWNP